MQIFEQFYIILVLVCLALFSSIREIRTNKFLIALLILLIYSELIRIIAEANAGQIPVVLIVLACIARSLFTPGAYLHFRNHFYQSRLRRSDILHLLPFATLCVGLIVNYLLNQNFDFLTYNKSQGIALSVSSEVILVCFIAYTYCTTGIYFWLTLLTIKNKNERLSRAGSVNNTTSYPELSESHETIAVESSHRSIILSEERITEMSERVKGFLTEKRPFLQHKYSLADLSRDTKISVHHLSAFINNYHKMNFNDFINVFRVEHCKEKILNDECRYKKLEAIAGESGFNNRNTFATAFKKVTGLNPSEFLKSTNARARA